MYCTRSCISFCSSTSCLNDLERRSTSIPNVNTKDANICVKYADQIITVSMGKDLENAKSVMTICFANMKSLFTNASSVGGVVFVFTRDYTINAKLAKEVEYAATDVTNHIVKSVEDLRFAYMGKSKTSAYHVVALRYALMVS